MLFLLHSVFPTENCKEDDEDDHTEHDEAHKDRHEDDDQFWGSVDADDARWSTELSHMNSECQVLVGGEVLRISHLTQQGLKTAKM